MGKINHKVMNYVLEHLQFVSVRELEEDTGCKILHKLIPVMKRYYHGELPKKISKVEFDIILAKLKEEELDYRKRVKLKKTQRRLDEWGVN